MNTLRVLRQLFDSTVVKRSLFGPVGLSVFILCPILKWVSVSLVRAAEVSSPGFTGYHSV